MTDINYHLELQGKSVKKFMKWLDLQILVKECKHKECSKRIYKEKVCVPTDILSSLLIAKQPLKY